ncbi:hypothetical protein HUT16_08165 [Kitasatospora sp. NA04385]|uniref:DUF6215 domain-containing protein n=1 Tax=Kitasatospora sp. NA04385 TaxID=2742135 RepID=UPI0015902F07|nr:DUF6215 domain-containing protein [Kitasatospora sp. NA04385]QKW19045.1 hypothetical protein HUT16_08165 [Kitasatospora sp. NA04385]
MQDYLAGVGRRIAVRAVAGVCAVAGGLFWHSVQESGHHGSGKRAEDGGPAVCAPIGTDWPAGYPAMCAALNRPDLPELLGVPGEHAVAAGVGSYSRWDAGAAQVQVGRVTVAVSDRPAVPYDLLLDDTGVSVREVAPVAGRPAVAYAEPTLWLTVNLGSGGSGSPAAAGSGGSDPGGSTYHLVVARNADGSGGSLELSLWRDDDGYLDSALLPGLAEKLMAGLDGWNAPPLPAEPGQPTRPPRPSPSPSSFRPFSGDR